MTGRFFPSAEAVGGIRDQAALRTLALEHPDPLGRMAALERIEDAAFLEERAERDPDEDVRLAAVILFLSASRQRRYHGHRQLRILGEAARRYERLGFFDFSGKMYELAGDYARASRAYRNANLEWERVEKRVNLAEKVWRIAPT